MPDTRLIVRADDAGSGWASNIGCLRACTDGVARSVEVMMPCAWVNHAALIFGERPDIDIGIHLTLTSEWDAVKWRPLTAAKTIVDDTGAFLPLLTPREGDARRSLQESDWSIDEISREFRAQIELGVAMFPHASHISSHMIRHFKEFDPRLEEIVSDLCSESGLKDDPFGHGLPRIEGYRKFPRSAEARISAFVAELAGLASGTYIFIDHPAVESPELAASGHRGYEDVEQDRVTCLQTLSSAELQEQVEQSGIQLISYRDL
ncbi:ChbG/HpnK family deacetylase [Roseibium marinum]|uniref:ChbG/HpnK family deacetylase n=1 Tax=Roseibium marinum TaxID=281252 RepID=A0A2S3V4D5_9HYPH|nr:ChbG/HpnK family deacetylase [Roseibium marinum]POF34796.1 hypothetical protein CLV41_1011256 [Roseibium marinum]